MVLGGTSTVSTTIVAQNTQDTSLLANASDLVATVSASSSLIGKSGSASLFNNGQNGLPGGLASLSTIASTATIANPAPNSIFLEPDQVLSKPDTITFDPFPGLRELPGSNVPDAVGVPAPAEALGQGRWRGRHRLRCGSILDGSGRVRPIRRADGDER